MVQYFTEGNHPEEFLFSEGNGNISREKGTVSGGQGVLKAGQVLQITGGELVAITGTVNTAGDIVTPAAGVLSYDVDTTGGDVLNVPYIARDAEVVSVKLTLPGGTTQKNAAIKSLKDSCNIILR